MYHLLLGCIFSVGKVYAGSLLLKNHWFRYIKSLLWHTFIAPNAKPTNTSITIRLHTNIPRPLLHLLPPLPQLLTPLNNLIQFSAFFKVEVLRTTWPRHIFLCTLFSYFFHLFTCLLGCVLHLGWKCTGEQGRFSYDLGATGYSVITIFRHAILNIEYTSILNIDMIFSMLLKWASILCTSAWQKATT